MIFSTVNLPRGLLVETARRTMSVSVTIPTNFFPFFTNSDPTRAVFIVLAALTTETPGPTVLSCFFIIFSTVDMRSPFIDGFPIKPAGCSKRPSSKAAGESKPEAYPQGYVEDFDELRTKLEAVFNIMPPSAQSCQR